MAAAHRMSTDSILVPRRRSIEPTRRALRRTARFPQWFTAHMIVASGP
jgi:hypothetical protein